MSINKMPIAPATTGWQKNLNSITKTKNGGKLTHRTSSRIRNFNLFYLMHFSKKGAFFAGVLSL